MPLGTSELRLRSTVSSPSNVFHLSPRLVRLDYPNIWERGLSIPVIWDANSLQHQPFAQGSTPWDRGRSRLKGKFGILRFVDLPKTSRPYYLSYLTSPCFANQAVGRL